jgi:mono/diheme cytochrome c family protein
MKRISLFAVVIACAALSACQSNKNNSAWAKNPVGGGVVAMVASAATNAPATSSTTSSGKGVGPVDHVDLASLDESTEERGAKLFQEKCSACHKLDERYIGPALAGVTERRQPEWILNMILNPEVMIQQDPTAKALLAQFIAPMANQHLTREEAECVLVYFREHDHELAEKDDEGEDDEHEESSSGAGSVNGH